VGIDDPVDLFDIDLDGDSDLIYYSIYHTLDRKYFIIHYLTNNGDGTFSKDPEAISEVEYEPYLLNDLNMDGYQDIIGSNTVNEFYGNEIKGLEWSQNGGNFHFADPQRANPWVGDIDKISSAQLNRDKKPDIIAISGNKIFWFENNIQTSTSFETGNHVLPEKVKLCDNYPNPFNPSTEIKFSIPKTSNVQLIVYDLLGRKVTTLVDDRFQAGNHSVKFNAGNLSSGVYIYRLEANEFIQTRKMMLVK